MSALGSKADMCDRPRLLLVTFVYSLIFAHGCSETDHYCSEANCVFDPFMHSASRKPMSLARSASLTRRVSRKNSARWRAKHLLDRYVRNPSHTISLHRQWRQQYEDNTGQLHGLR